MGKVRYKTHREIALENDIFQTRAKLHALREELKWQIANHETRQELDCARINLERVETIMAILDVPFFVYENDISYHE